MLRNKQGEEREFRVSNRVISFHKPKPKPNAMEQYII